MKVPSWEVLDAWRCLSEGLACEILSCRQDCSSWAVLSLNMRKCHRNRIVWVGRDLKCQLDPPHASTGEGLLLFFSKNHWNSSSAWSDTVWAMYMCPVTAAMAWTLSLSQASPAAAAHTFWGMAVHRALWGCVPSLGTQDRASCPSVTGPGWSLWPVFNTSAEKRWMRPSLLFWKAQRDISLAEESTKCHVTSRRHPLSCTIPSGPGGRKDLYHCWPHLEDQHSWHFGEWNNIAASIHRTAGDWKQDCHAVGNCPAAVFDLVFVTTFLLVLDFFFLFVC